MLAFSSEARNTQDGCFFLVFVRGAVDPDPERKNNRIDHSSRVFFVLFAPKKYARSSFHMHLPTGHLPQITVDTTVALKRTPTLLLRFASMPDGFDDATTPSPLLFASRGSLAVCMQFPRCAANECVATVTNHHRC